MNISRKMVIWTALSAFVMTFNACGGNAKKKKPAPGELGTECDPAQDGSCAEALVCGPRGDGFACAYAPGSACDPSDSDLENGGCSDAAVCQAPEVAEGEEELPPACYTLEGEECSVDGDDYCADGRVCAEVEDGTMRCFAPVVMRGMVTDSSNGSPIGEAQVIAVDDEGVAVSDVAITDEDGNYELAVPVERNEDGEPIDSTFTLRAAAQEYLPFPRGIRVALPISTEGADSEDGAYVVDSALTDIALIPLETDDLFSISGQIVQFDGSKSVVGGVLVVASGSDDAISAITDKSGEFTLFNVPDGDYELSGYAAEIQIEAKDVSVDGEPLADVKLTELDEATTTVSGSINLVNPGGYSVTSVILVVEDTFDADAARGEVPRGLRAPRSGEVDVSGAFNIENVPRGSYVALAAYENDGLVRDPDTSIAGTDFVYVDVNAGQDEVTLSQSFKVTGALEVISPGVDGPEEVSSAPTLTWADDSSEKWYEVRVFDAFGNEVWQDLDVPSVSGNSEVTVEYGGPLEPGMYYQFRASSWNQSGNPISATEDLRGVFFAPAK